MRGKWTCFLLLIVLFIIISSLPCWSQKGEVYPPGKIIWLIPYKAGGGFDQAARLITPFLSKYLKEKTPGGQIGIVIQNEPASGGRRAYSKLYEARPDGHTIGAFDIGFISDTFTEDVGFDISKFTFLVRAMKTKRLVVTAKGGPANWEDLVKLAKGKPLKWGAGAYLQSTHLDSIVLTERLGVPVKFIPWAGGTAEVMNALMRGDIHVALVSEDSVRGLLNAGEIKCILEISEKSAYPGVPTIKDLGHPDLAFKLGTQRFIVAPPKFPNHLRNIFIDAVKKVMTDEKFRSYTKKVGIEFDPLYGKEAEQEFKMIFNYYHGVLKPLYLKYAK